MRYCEACQISFSVDSNDCPFCENKLVIRTMSNELQNYPHYKKTETEKYYWKKAFNYSVISLLIVSTYLNMFGWSQHPYFWSLIFNAGVIYLWKIVKVTIFEKNYKRKGRFLWQQSISLYLLLFFMDFFFNSESFIFMIMSPLLIFSTSIILLFILVGKSRTTNQDLSFLLLTIVCNCLFSIYYVSTKVSVSFGLILLSSVAIILFLLFHFMLKDSVKKQIKIMFHYD